MSTSRASGANASARLIPPGRPNGSDPMKRVTPKPGVHRVLDRPAHAHIPSQPADVRPALTRASGQQSRQTGAGPISGRDSDVVPKSGIGIHHGVHPLPDDRRRRGPREGRARVQLPSCPCTQWSGQRTWGCPCSVTSSKGSWFGCLRCEGDDGPGGASPEWPSGSRTSSDSIRRRVPGRISIPLADFEMTPGKKVGLNVDEQEGGPVGLIRPSRVSGTLLATWAPASGPGSCSG
jgi:hypothetical protein